MSKKKFYLFFILVVVLFIVMASIGCNKYPTNGTKNKNTDKSGTKPVFSDLGGFFTGTMTLEMSLPDEFADSGYDILYTVDGSNPETNGILYSEPFLIDTTNAKEFEEKAISGLENVKSLILDFAELDYISSAGLRVVLVLIKQMKRQGSMLVTNTNEMVKEIFEVTGFADLVDVK